MLVVIHVRWVSIALTFSFTPVLSFGTKSYLEHPALLAGCVCVCVYLPKRSKTCILPWWPFTWNVFSFQIPPSAFTWWTGLHEYFLSVLDEQGVQSSTFQSCTNEDTEWYWWYHDWSSWRTCFRDAFTWWSTNVRLILGFLVSSCWFALIQEHLLSWLRHLMP